MELKKIEKRRIFASLLSEYPDFEITRLMAKMHGIVDKKAIANVNKEERAAYRLIKKFAKELGVKIPKYKTPE